MPGPASPPDSSAGAVAALDRRVRRLTQGLAALALLWAATVGGLIAARPPATPGLQIPADGILRVRGVIVVDDRGTPRVQIGAPLPDPPVLGRRIGRGGTANGILLFDREGNERGGYATFDESGLAMLSLDEVGNMVVRLAASSSGGAHLLIRDAAHELWLGTATDGPYVRFQQGGSQRILRGDAAR